MQSHRMILCDLLRGGSTTVVCAVAEIVLMEGTSKNNNELIPASRGREVVLVQNK